MFLAAAGLLAWFHATPAPRRADRRAAAAGRALVLAIDRFAQAHSGVYPPTEDITGGAGDSLTRSGGFAFYPDNPYHPGRKMKNVPFGSFSPGDFSYMRNPDKSYAFSLVVYARTPHSGPRGDGVLFRHQQNP